jgi:hypothetical protein
MLVMMKNKLTLDLVEFDLLAIQFCGDVWFPEFGDLGEFFGDIDFVHGIEFLAAVRFFLLRKSRKESLQETESPGRRHPGPRRAYN